MSARAVPCQPPGGSVALPRGLGHRLAWRQLPASWRRHGRLRRRWCPQPPALYQTRVVGAAARRLLAGPTRLTAASAGAARHSRRRAARARCRTRLLAVRRNASSARSPATSGCTEGARRPARSASRGRRHRRGGGRAPSSSARAPPPRCGSGERPPPHPRGRRASVSRTPAQSSRALGTRPRGQRRRGASWSASWSKRGARLRGCDAAYERCSGDVTKITYFRRRGAAG